ncbi:MAG TPA: putative porin [Dysgonamonadaceae bacterium]|nr:putative porin [Dysgonamonadaceae bacterium]
MKEKLVLLCLWSFFAVVSVAQQPHIIMPDSSQITSDKDSLGIISRQSNNGDLTNATVPHLSDSLKNYPRFTVWKIHERTGERYSTLPDTLLYNYQQSTLPDGHSIAMGHLGNLGSPVLSKVYFDRGESSQFFFYDSYYLYNKNPNNQLFFNTRIPYARVNYQRSGGNIDKEERMETRFTMNFNRHLNVGFDLDFINAKGFYASQAVKQNNYSAYANYLSDRFEVHAYGSQTSVTNFENGGISDSIFITNPESIEENFSSRDIPTRMKDTWNRLKTNQFYLSARYNLGYNKEVADDAEKEFVPVASLIFTSKFKEQYRRFLSYDTTNVVRPNMSNAHAIDTLYNNRYYKSAVDDSTRYSSFKNTIALSMREGFRDWVKFGLTAFLEHETRNFNLLDTINDGRYRHREQATTIGGILSKQQGEFLRFNAQADLGILGANLGEFRIEGDATTSIMIAGKRTSLSAQAYIKNLKPKFLEQQYHSKYFWWNNDFSDTRRVYLGGQLFIPFTNTTISAGVENIQNLIYFDRNKLPFQESDNIQIVSARVDQDLKAGIFNWNNSIVYQTSSNESAIPVPTLSAYSNMFLKTKIVDELTLQLGLDAHYHTKYYAPGYEPALLQFYNQREKEIGNYPIVTGYANMHLKQIRFFVMFYNIGHFVMKPNYFSLPDYPFNPMLLKLGVSVNLNY